MKSLSDVFRGRIALWRVFWLVALPSFALNYYGTGCGLAGHCAVFGDDFVLLGVILISGLGVLLTAVPVWRSATNYTGTHSWAAMAAKVYVCISTPIALLMEVAGTVGLIGYALTGHK